MLIAYTTVMSVWASRESRAHVCTGIEVDVETSGVLDSTIIRGINEELHKYPTRIVGTPLHQLRTNDIENYLARYHNFESVHCLISSRGKLVVKIEPLVPVMRVFFGDNSYYINKDGKHIISNAEYYSDVPIVSGMFNRNFTPKDVLPLVNYIRKDGVLSEMVSMIEARNADNLILVPRIRGHVINFGDTANLDDKKRALSLFYRQVIPYKGWEEYDTISVKFRGQVVATRRDKSRKNHAEEYEDEIAVEEATLPDVTDGGIVQTDTTTHKKKTPANQSAV